MDETPERQIARLRSALGCIQGLAIPGVLADANRALRRISNLCALSLAAWGSEEHIKACREALDEIDDSRQADVEALGPPLGRARLEDLRSEMEGKPMT